MTSYIHSEISVPLAKKYLVSNKLLESMIFMIIIICVSFYPRLQNNFWSISQQAMCFSIHLQTYYIQQMYYKGL